MKKKIKEKIQAFKVKIAILLVSLAEWISPRAVSKESIEAEAKRIYPYVTILWSDDDMWTFAFRLFIDRKIINKNEQRRFVKKAELQRRSKAKKQAAFIEDAKKILKRNYGENSKRKI